MNRPTTLAGLLAVTLAATAHGHFAWLTLETTDSGEPVVRGHFGEAAVADGPPMLDYLQGSTVWRIDADGATGVTLKPAGDSLQASAIGGAALYALTKDLGTMTRDDETFALKYAALTGPDAGEAVWRKADLKEKVRLTVVPRREANRIVLTVEFDGKPAKEAQVVFAGPDTRAEKVERTTDSRGSASFDVAKAGRHEIRVRHTTDEAGAADGNAYARTRYYTTLTLEAAGPLPLLPVAAELPDLPVALTSFGGAYAGGRLYAFGGNMGGAHKYSADDQNGTLFALDLADPVEWKEVATGPHVQGNALVAHGDTLYRVGGFEARNGADEEQDLHSTAGAAAFDTRTGQWRDLPDLPQARSSLDAAVLGDRLYVVGGWNMAGAADAVWHDTLCRLDLSADAPQWQSLPAPFRRRALSVAAHQGRLYAIGGMNDEDAVSGVVEVFDPASGTWSKGPELRDGWLDGFGSSAFATAGRLYVTTSTGTLFRLAESGDAWEKVALTPTARFFHRMVPVGPGKLAVFGGTSMTTGKFAEVEILDVNAPLDTAAR